KEVTTARLSRRWRWALPAMAAGALLWYFQGLPGGTTGGIEALAARQAAALSTGDLDAYARTLRSNVAGNREDLLRWAAQLTSAGSVKVGITVKDVDATGSTARATWQTLAQRPGLPPEMVSRQTTLVRRWGRWYESCEAYAMLNGFDVDVTAIFNPIDPSAKAIPLRNQVSLIASASDNAFAAVEPLFPDKPGAPRPQVKLFPSLEAWGQFSGNDPEVGSASVWYIAGEPIRVSPDFLKGSKRWDIERSLAYEFMKFLSETRLGENRVSPLVLGGWDLHQDPNLSTYRIDVSRLSGNPIFTLEELYATSAEELTQERQFLYATQAALLAEYAEKHLPERPIPALTIAQLAGRLGTTPNALAKAYREYVLERIYSESLLTIPAAKPRIPVGLAEAVEARGQAVATGDEAAFAGMSDPSALSAQTDWFKRLQQAGVVQYSTSFLDFAGQREEVSFTVPVLEQVTFADGRQVAGVVMQRWMDVKNQWVILDNPATLVK
ncbi:MAG TPA: hypothetical protein VD973_03370, partial [Symbiobacteriaceae bacterium]|nr:hypothetical protein [Symbiobacteriaceae bacterium]